MKKENFFFLLALIIFCSAPKIFSAGSIKISKEVLRDKIKGGWAGQTIGVTYGAPTEFRFQGTMVNDYQRIPWSDTLFAWWYKSEPGLYDDLYMDLTFVDVFEKHGLNTPVDSFASAFANAGYVLWHANQAARYNILNGTPAPSSGFWKNNPHADCIDFQIEADFAGLMSPAMPNVAAKICDKIGHIMNYGDGWYGGVFVANMYAYAFISNDIKSVILNSLSAIPAESDFHKCISDVIKWYKENPNDWKSAWFKFQKKWTDDISCPDGVFTSFNIDAKVNSAYIVIGLLYGNSDYEKTMDIAMRCGQDSDCNPSNAAGILGTMMGYNRIPERWKGGLKSVEEVNFKYTSISLNKVYEISYKHALENILNNGGSETEKDVLIKKSPNEVVKYEKSFPDLFPIERRRIIPDSTALNDCVLKFEGSGFVITGNIDVDMKTYTDYTAKLQVIIDEGKPEEILLPRNFRTRKHEIYWNYNLPNRRHVVKIKLLNPTPEAEMRYDSVIIYSASSSKS